MGPFGANLPDSDVNCRGIERILTECARATRAAGREICLVARKIHAKPKSKTFKLRVNF